VKVTGKMVKCPKCGKEMIDKGLGGHLYGVHMIRVGDKAELASLRDVKTKSEQRIIDLERRLNSIHDLASQKIVGESMLGLIKERSKL
jgi:hypothetical protein